jgi:hypothetical protein
MAGKILVEDKADRWIGQIRAINLKVYLHAHLCIRENQHHLRRRARCYTFDIQICAPSCSRLSKQKPEGSATNLPAPLARIEIPAKLYHIVTAPLLARIAEIKEWLIRERYKYIYHNKAPHTVSLMYAARKNALRIAPGAFVREAALGGFVLYNCILNYI